MGMASNMGITDEGHNYKIDYKKLESTISENLTVRHWGVRAPKSTDFHRPMFYIMDYRGLALSTGIVRYMLSKSNIKRRIFYRGQEQSWPLRPSLYRFCETKEEVREAEQWLEKALDCIRDVFDKEGTDDLREALAQHYSLKTRYIDVVDHIQTALWFAYDHVKKAGERSRKDEAVGYIQVIAIPEKDATIYDLREKPSQWLRPHIQQGFSVKMKYPGKRLGDISQHVVMTLIVNRENLRRWSNYDNIPREYFYPSSAVDNGAKYWEDAERKLIKERLLISNGDEKIYPIKALTYTEKEKKPEE